MSAESGAPPNAAVPSPTGAGGAGGAEPDALEPLARNRDFRVVLIGQGISAFGDAVSNTALPLLVLTLTGSGAAMGVVGALSTLPDLIFGLFAGAWAGGTPLPPEYGWPGSPPISTMRPTTSLCSPLP